ncbi:DUF3429 domain-containing protein [Thioclava sp. GXIMD2076]|uniref:DUF3429 domain-containing protein n=1 Tax=Thioclava sp. GXIMD2076 TaxID=3131931 RepID=UPI0030D45B39
MTQTQRSFTIRETAGIPFDGEVFGWLPVMPMALGMLGMFFLPGAWQGVCAAATAVWGSAILLFLAGVRRGLSFRTPGGVRAVQLLTMLVYFLWGLASLLAPLSVSLWMLCLGYAAIALIDPIAARRGEAPLYFARLRPVQMGAAAVIYGAVALGF